MKQDTHHTDDRITKILTDTTRITAVLQAGIYDALLKHKQAGNPVCGRRNNQIVWIQPEEILIDEWKKTK